ncbi:hypothetical protein [Bacteroides acidifaciens]|uniref:hypothetical protein n=1 Tax=Bacteroides acidifaciens TaxID=85831 RepID=UPI0023C00C69|nr:hypothetical protein [Bacteroides acidifaciens]MDE6819820.1 hypothetical protein [Bacteroides acidifaciens]
MRIVIIIVIMIGLSSCSKSQVPEDNSRPFPRDNSVGLRFINEAGDDASDIIKMKLTGTNTTFPDNSLEYYEMVSENYSYHCFIDGNEVPLTFKINGEGTPIESIVKVEISKRKTEKYKTFWLVVNSVYIIHNDINSDRLYEFDYRFRLPSLFGEQENSLKVVTKAKNLGKKIYEKVSFNGEEISHDNGNTFDIAISKM